MTPSTRNYAPTPALPRTFEQPSSSLQLNPPSNSTIGQPRQASPQSIIAPPAERHTLREVPLTAGQLRVADDQPPAERRRLGSGRLT